jgi:hypothetical protein
MVKCTVGKTLRAEVHSYGYAVSQLSNDSGFITADAIPTGLVFWTQIITGQKTFSEDIIVGSTASSVHSSTNSIDVHTGRYCLRSHLGLVHTVL